MENALKASIAEEYRTQLLQAVDNVYYYGDEMLFTDDVAESSMDGDGATSSTAKSQPARTEGEDFSGTNNQEQGVDEADFVKTDGYYIYLLQDSTLTITGVPELSLIHI